MILWLAVAFLYGITIGSFLNVVIWRLPRGGSVASPTWSYCPRCEHRLGAAVLIPVFSFLALRARCLYCKAPISWRYPGIELLTGLLFLAVAWRFGGTLDTVFYCLFIAILICVFFIDLEHFIIPDGLNVLGVSIGIVHNAVEIAQKRPDAWSHIGHFAVPASLVGMLGYAGVIYLIGLLSYVWLVSVMDKRLPVWKATGKYIGENIADWGYVTVYYLGALIPPLRRFAEPPEPLEGFTAEEIEEDEDAGGMGGGDGKLAAAIGANLYLGLALQSWMFSILLGALFGIAYLLQQRRRLGGRTPVPFGPAMVGGALIALFFGYSITSWYVKTFWNFPGSPFMPSPASVQILGNFFH